MTPRTAIGLVSFWLIAAPLSSAPPAAPNALRAEAVQWARLKTPSEWWMRHARGDPVLMRFIRQSTSLNIHPTWYVADSEKLNELCAYPLLFSQGIHMLETPSSRNNVAEYVRRGGFLLIDACINRNITPDPDVFLTGQKRMLAETLPEAQVIPLPPEHEIYGCFFQIPDRKPPHTFDSAVYDPRWARHGLYAIMIGPRMAGLISLSGLQCGWDGMVAPVNHEVACMKMLVNIYIRAMTGDGGVTKARMTNDE